MREGSDKVIGTPVPGMRGRRCSVTMKESEGMKSSGRAGGAAWLAFPEDALDPPEDEEERDARRGEAEAGAELGVASRSVGVERTLLRVGVSAAAAADASSDFKRANFSDSRTFDTDGRRLDALTGSWGQSSLSKASSAGSSDFLRAMTTAEDLKLRVFAAKTD
jgi:hypothetical protein